MEEHLKSKYVYDCFITKMSKFGLLDETGNLIRTSYDYDELVIEKHDLGWGKIIKIKLTDKGIEFKEVVLK
jgi:hypothetical protein